MEIYFRGSTCSRALGNWYHRFQSDPMFVHWPDFYVAFWVLPLDFQDEPTQIFFPLLKFCGYLIPGVGDEELLIDTSWTWDIPTLCRRQTFSPLSSLIQSATLRPFHSPPSGGGSCKTYHNHRLFHIIQQRVTIGIFATPHSEGFRS